MLPPGGTNWQLISLIVHVVHYQQLLSVTTIKHCAFYISMVFPPFSRQLEEKNIPEI
jgi:hypothetical protein